MATILEFGRRPLVWIADRTCRLAVLLAIGLPQPAQAQSTAEPLPAGGAESVKLHTLHFSDPPSMKEFFRYAPDRLPFVSAHRGGPGPGYPENCLATFDHTLQSTWAVMEVDPHYTKDGAIVLMHDDTLDRTSTGRGKIADHTLDELRRLRLKDAEGKPTDHQIPTLAEALEWARGKTILILDQKDVPAEARARAIRDHHAQTRAMVMCYSFADARKCHDVDKDIMMEVFVPDRSAVLRFDATGVPWSNVVAFVSHGQPRESDVFSLIHDRGALCIMGSSRNLDRDFREGAIGEAARDEGYRRLVESGADVIEADLATAAGAALRPLQSVKSSKRSFFSTSQ